MSTLTGIPLASLTPTALLGVVVALILLGQLVPRRTLKDAHTERDNWRTAWTVSEAARAVTLEQLREAMEQGRTTNAIIQRARASSSGPDPARQGKRQPGAT